jgi:hypothetical protein
MPVEVNSLSSSDLLNALVKVNCAMPVDSAANAAECRGYTW